MIDLTPYCYVGDLRPYIEKPWSMGEYTYATNGHILIRVARRADAPDFADVPHAIKDPEKVFRAIAHLDSYKPLPAYKLPPFSEDECEECGGDGHAEHCCTCECECDECDGTGVVSSDKGKSVEYRGVYFALKYIRLICALPNVELTDPTPCEPMGYRFDGGAGALMPLRHATQEVVPVFAHAEASA